MAVLRYKLRWTVDGDIYYDRINQVTLPTESFKYLGVLWNDAYTWRRLADRVYGDPNYYWLIMKASGITNPYRVKAGDKISILRPEYINEVKVNGQ